MEKVSREMKYMAARYDMLRQAEIAGAIHLTKVHTSLNIADIFTKPLAGEDFRRLRAMVMGCEAWTV